MAGLSGLKISTVAMEDVPEPTGGRVSCYAPLYDQIKALPQGKTLRVGFQSAVQALGVRAALRKLAQKDGRMLSSSKEDGGATRFFWLEPK